MIIIGYKNRIQVKSGRIKGEKYFYHNLMFQVDYVVSTWFILVGELIRSNPRKGFSWPIWDILERVSSLRV